MRTLAVFVMNGRRQAILAAVVSASIPLVYFICPVIVALVALRKGYQEAGLVLAWGCLGLALWTVYPAVSMDQAVNALPYLLLFVVTGLALVLRASGSWQLTALLAVGVGLMFELYLRLQPQTVDLMLSQLQELMLQNNVEQQISRSELVALIATVQTATAVLLLIWARSLQAKLYNPGGFGEEFQALRIDIRAAGPLVALLLLSGFGVGLLESWYGYFAIPFVLAGVALVHATVATRQLSSLWLVAFYAVFVVIAQLVVMLAVIDSWYDFRKHMRNAV